MTNGANSGIIKFLDQEYTIDGLEKAIGKSNETYIEPNSAFHELSFDQSLLPTNWREKFRKPVVTHREGKYVLIFMPEGGPILSKGFKARFVTKYNLNQAKPYVAPKVDVNTPIYEEPAPRTIEKKTYDRPKQYQSGGGYNNNRRYGGRS